MEHRFKTRFQRKVEKHIKESDPNYETNQYFMSIYLSEYNREDWDTLTIDWDFTRFLEHSNRVLQKADLVHAQQLDEEFQNKMKELSKRNPLGG